MVRFFLSFCLPLFSAFSFAQGGARVQVDVIIFTHTDIQKTQLERSASTEIQDLEKAIPLRTHHVGESYSYELISTSHSKLQGAWYRLNRQAEYQPLFHYTWVQPANNQSAVLLPQQSNQGWVVHGTVRVRQSNYYLLDTVLEFKPLRSSAPGFVLSQKMRLKPGNTYYLDHPQGGMLINVHKV